MSTTPPREIERDLRQKHSTYQRTALILTGLAVVLNLIIGAFELYDVADDRRQAEAIEGLVVRIDCRQRGTLQEVIDGLVAEGILEADSVRVVLDECQALTIPTTPEENP